MRVMGMQGVALTSGGCHTHRHCVPQALARGAHWLEDPTHAVQDAEGPLGALHDAQGYEGVLGYVAEAVHQGGQRPAARVHAGCDLQVPKPDLRRAGQLSGCHDISHIMQIINQMSSTHGCWAGTHHSCQHPVQGWPLAFTAGSWVKSDVCCAQNRLMQGRITRLQQQQVGFAQA